MFLFVFFVVIYLWDSTTADIQMDLSRYEMKWLSNAVSEQLVRTPGYPKNWKKNEVQVYGLAEIDRIGEYSIGVDRVIDPDKLLFLIMNIRQNYSEMRRTLLGSSRFDFYMVLTCLNSSKTDCFQGLTLDDVNIPVMCSNGYNFTLRNHVTDTHIWIEAEDAWGYNMSEGCNRGCSNGMVSDINLADSVVRNFSVNPGAYTIWVRGKSESSTISLVVDEKPYRIFDTIRNIVEWKRIGDFEFTEDVSLFFNSTNPASMIDSILLTTDPTYDPRINYADYFGNPNIFDECIVGNYTGGKAVSEFVSAIKTASFSEPIEDLSLLSGKQRFLKNTFQLRFVIWGGGTYYSIPEETTSSTIPATGIEIGCTGKPELSCVDGSNPIIVIDGVNIRDPLKCGDSTEVVVSWHGSHRGDYNHFGFFLDDQFHFLDACNSTNGTPEDQDQSYKYDMLCMVNVPNDLDAADGFHDLIITGEDFSGYCPPDTSGLADAIYDTQVLLGGCIQYTDISGTGTLTSLKDHCIPAVDSIERIYWINVDPEPLTCNDVAKVSVYWAGMHGADASTYWSFLLDNGTDYILLDACKTDMAEINKTFYNMTCDVEFSNFELTNLDQLGYRLIVTGETAQGYCPRVSEAEVVDDRIIQWNPCT